MIDIFVVVRILIFIAAAIVSERLILGQMERADSWETITNGGFLLARGSAIIIAVTVAVVFVKALKIGG